MELICDMLQEQEHFCVEAATLVSQAIFQLFMHTPSSIFKVNIYSLLQCFTTRYLGF